MDWYSLSPGRIGRDSYYHGMGETMMFSHPSCRKSGTTLVDMKQPEPEPVVVEITAENETTFRTQDLGIAKAFLLALGLTEVLMVCGRTSVQTGADIALLILERETD